MKFTDLFIRRPVLSVVVSLFILVLGIRAIFSLSITQYPQTESANIIISTTYYGADAATVAGFITQPLEAAIAQAQGIEYLSSSSSTGTSTHHRHAAPELRLQPGAHRNQRQGELGAQPAAAAGPAAGRHHRYRRYHRRDVHRILHRHAAAQWRDGLPDPRGAAEAGFHSRRAVGGCAGRARVRAARVAGSGAHGGAQCGRQ